MSKEPNYHDNIWLDWLAEVLSHKPKNTLLDSPRGEEVIRLCFDHERHDFNWHRSDPECFWIDVQLFIYYGFSDEQILFMLKQQPGIDNYSKHADERKAYAEMMRGWHKLCAIAEGLSLGEYKAKHQIK
ncbi:hypothetical protein [Streptococcus gallolyticus]|uniref:Uncharacterized protein n=1 Tax=Streptococcus gallolyticus TaxID=315405 RepID=A0A1H9V7S1_9STRE|nr:hypothetical protein [Streptococcus gallolyticus]SES17297.1 hypothetical protein SAMN04487840_12033 [Streptococcus gallolyticus]